MPFSSFGSFDVGSSSRRIRDRGRGRVVGRGVAAAAEGLDDCGRERERLWKKRENMEGTGEKVCERLFFFFEAEGRKKEEGGRLPKVRVLLSSLS